MKDFTQGDIPRVLSLARTILANNRWIRGTYARTRSGVGVGPSHEDAACFCPLGAISRACFELGFESSDFSDGFRFSSLALRNTPGILGVTVHKENDRLQPLPHNKRAILDHFDAAVRRLTAPENER